MQFIFEVKDDSNKKVYEVEYFDGALRIIEFSEVIRPETRLGAIIVSKKKLNEILNIADSEYEARIL